MNEKQFAQDFMQFVYNKIKHGDAKHKRWLKTECVKLERTLAARVRRTRDETPAAKRRR